MDDISVSSNYRALAIRYRPKRLTDLVGHESTIRMLSNAIRMNRIHHSFLLTGTRGIGKTTIARIIALSLNCIGKEGEITKPTDNPCLECENCRHIINGNHPDVVEFDAASKTGVDSIREIIESCEYAPMMARYKIYIVDEVHMLSKGAFNALLKTVEEPADRVKFIFATTELKKVPITILSRCQKFLLRNLTVPELAEFLQKICAKEGYRISDESVISTIARFAGGSVRDSLSILDQAMSMSEDKMISQDSVRAMLAIPEVEMISSFLHAVLKKNPENAIQIATEISSATQDAEYVLSTLMRFITDLSKSTVGNTPVEDINLEFVKKEGIKLDFSTLNRMWQICANAMQNIDCVGISTTLEMLAMSLIFSACMPTTREVISALREKLKEKVV